MSALSKILARLPAGKALAALSGALDDTSAHLSRVPGLLDSDPEGAARELEAARESLARAREAARGLGGDEP